MTFLHILWLSPFIMGPFLWSAWYFARVTPQTLKRWQFKLRGALRSKTIWVNGLALAFVKSIPELVDYAAQNFPAMQPYLPANHYTSAMGAITIANILLRFKTAHPLEAK